MKLETGVLEVTLGKSLLPLGLSFFFKKEGFQLGSSVTTRQDHPHSTFEMPCRSQKEPGQRP